MDSRKIPRSNPFNIKIIKEVKTTTEFKGVFTDKGQRLHPAPLDILNLSTKDFFTKVKEEIRSKIYAFCHLYKSVKKRSIIEQTFVI